MPVLDACFVGKIYLPDLWSGPIMPPGQPPTQPPGQPVYPQFPIWGPPGMTLPPVPGYPPWVGGGPIVPPTTPPDNGGGGSTPPFKPVIGWTPQTGWVVVFVPAEGTLVPTPSAAKVEVTKVTPAPEAKKP